MKTGLFIASTMVIVILLGACSAPPLPLASSPVGAAEISTYVTKNTDITGEKDLSWIEIKDEYETRFNNGLTLSVGHNPTESFLRTGKDGGYYKLLELKPGQNSRQFLPLSFFLPGEVLVVESDGKPILYFKYDGGEVYMAKK